MFKRIDHVEIVTDRPEQTIDFYTNVLGFRIKGRQRIERTHLGYPLELVYLDLGGTMVEVMSYEGASLDAPPDGERLGYRMMALEVDDMQRTIDELAGKGVAVVWGPIVREKYARAEIRDPNGFNIELRQWID